MKRQDAGRPRSRPDHFTSGGDQVRWWFKIEVVALDGSVCHSMRIDIMASQALALSGHIGDLETGLSVLDNAKDAVNVKHRMNVPGLVIPGADVDIAKLGKVRAVRIEGPLEDRTYAIAVIESAKAALRNHHDRLALRPSGALSIERL